MLKTFLILFLSIAIFATVECGGLTSLFHRKTTTEQPIEEIVTTDATTVPGKTTSTVPAGYYIVNNIPKVEQDCIIKYACKKKLLTENPRPCIKFCVKSIQCANGTKRNGLPTECLELNPELVAHEYNDCGNSETESSTISTMQVAMIDFPCQPGYLPDSRGRCREVW